MDNPTFVFSVLAIISVNVFMWIINRIVRRSNVWTYRSSASLYLILLPSALALKIPTPTWLILASATAGVLMIASDVAYAAKRARIASSIAEN